MGRSYSVDEVASRLNVGVSTVLGYITSGMILANKRNGAFTIPEPEVDKMKLQVKPETSIGSRTGKPIRGLLCGTGASTQDFIEEKRRKNEERRKKIEACGSNNG